MCSQTRGVVTTCGRGGEGETGPGQPPERSRWRTHTQARPRGELGYNRLPVPQGSGKGLQIPARTRARARARVGGSPGSLQSCLSLMLVLCWGWEDKVQAGLYVLACSVVSVRDSDSVTESSKVAVAGNRPVSNGSR